MSDDDFFEDLDSILNSDNEIKKSQPATVVKEEIKSTPPEAPSSNAINKKDKNEVVGSNLFDDSDDDMDKLLMEKSPVKTKTKSPTIRPAKLALDNFLKSTNDDLDFNTRNNDSFFSNLKSNQKEDKKGDDGVMQRPLTMESNLKPSSNKRSVRFSNEMLATSDSSPELSPVKSRPITAPELFPTQPRKAVTRFEAAEDDFAPIKKPGLDKNTTFYDGNVDKTVDVYSTPTALNDPIKSKDIDPVSKKTDPKQKLNDFLDSDPIIGNSIGSFNPRLETTSGLKRSADAKSNLDEIFEPNVLVNGMSKSNNYQLDNTDIFGGDLGVRPRSAVSRRSLDFTANPIDGFDRPKTGHGRSDIDVKYNRETKFNESVPQNTTEYDFKLRKLESERDDLLHKLSMMDKRLKEETTLLETNYKSRMELVEENSSAKIKRLQEEIDILVEQNKQKLKMLESERMEMRTELSRQQEDFQNQKRQEITRMQEQHRLELEKLKLDQEQLVERVRRARETEQETVRAAQPTAARLQDILEKVSAGTEDLAGVRRELLAETTKHSEARDRELQLKAESLKIMEEKLEKEREENVTERNRLQSLIMKLDLQLKEQTKTYEEEKWSLRQEQNKLSVLQSNLEKEREDILLQKDNNRKAQDEFRQKMLTEQKQMFEQLYDEKRQLSEERAKLTREMARWSELNQFSDSKKNQEMAEVEGLKAAVFQEKNEMESQKLKFAEERNDLMRLKNTVSMQQNENHMKEDKLNQLERELNAKQNLLNGKEQYYLEIETSANDAFRKAKELHSTNQMELNKIQDQLSLLNEREKQIAREQLELEELKQEVIKNGGTGQKTVVCPRCTNDRRLSASILNKRPGINGSVDALTYSKLPYQTDGPGYQDDMVAVMDYTNYLASQAEEERLMKVIKTEAEEDREFLNQEAAFLNSLHYGRSNAV